MINVGTKMTVADNSGAKRVECIRLLGGTNRASASVGDIVVVAVKVALPTSSVKKGSVQRAIIVRTAKEYRRSDGTYIRFDENACVILDDSLQPRGRRVFGPVARELRDSGHMRIVSLAPEVL